MGGKRVTTSARLSFDRRSTYPTIRRLLSERSSTGMADGVSAAVRAAHSAGLSFRLTELNSVTCGGRPRVSDSFATALSAPDALFGLMRVGVDGVNVHIRDDAINAPFTLTRAGLNARPLMYGLALFARAWQGTRVVATIAPSRGVYELSLPGASAALVSLHLR
jgi:hypothetical protein